MLSVEQGSDNARFAQEFEDYRKACRERYLQQAAVQTPIPEEEEKQQEVEEKEADVHEEVNDHASEDAPSPRQDEAAEIITAPVTAPLQQDDANVLRSSVDSLKKSGKLERRNSLSKFISGVFAKKSSPTVTRQKKKLTKEEKENNEQDWRMARFIAELEYDGRSDQEIQQQLFHVRDMSQFQRPRSNSVGDWFKSMTQAFKDEFSVRRDDQLATVRAAAANPFYAAPSANYMHDIAYSYEDLVALENVPRGVKCLDHLVTLTYEGQELPSAQTTCAVCMMEFEKSEELRGLHCTHHFHKDCIDKWLAVGTTCPVCKSEVESDA